MPTARINRSFILRSLLFALLLLWPLLLFGRPAYMPDSAAYQIGGERAVSFVLGKMYGSPSSEQRSSSAPHAPEPVKEAADDTKVARSIPYSVLAYLLAGPDLTMVYMAVFHAITMALVITALFDAIAGPALKGFVAMVGITAFMTGLAPTVDFIVPDCYAAIVIGALMVLPFAWDRFSEPARLLVIGAAIFGVAVHPSHPPIALGIAAVATPVLWLFHRKPPGKPSYMLLGLWLPGLAGTALVMLTGLIGFGTASVAPKHHPLALARAIENGPARRYLEDACKDRHRYAICEIYGTDIPDNSWELLWSENSIIHRATPAQLDRVRSEEQEILIATTRRYPEDQARHILHDVPLQLVSYQLDYLIYTPEIVRDPDGTIILTGASGGTVPRLYHWLDILTNFSIIAGVGFLLWSWRRLTAPQKAMVLILATGLLANAAICAIFSGVAPRYQARVIWLIPFAAIAIGTSAAYGAQRWRH